MFFCSCGKQLPDDALYCMRCGKAQHEKISNHETIQFLKFGFSYRTVNVRSNDKQTVQYAFELFKPAVKYPDLLHFEVIENAWNLVYENRKIFSDHEYRMMDKAALFHEYAIINGWIADPPYNRTNENGIWEASGYSYTRKIEIG